MNERVTPDPDRTVPALHDQLQRTLGGAYTIERELGGGGMSRVFAAHERSLNREVVIKVLSADVAAGVSLERFGREIQLAASLQQANIVPLLSAGDADGVPYYTMPFVRGESLRGRLALEPRLTTSECVGILRDVARALSYAHARGVVHRDVKPDNVLLSHGAAVVTDFGIAKAVSASRTMGDRDTLTQVGTSIGTPAYMAPEQVAGDPNVDLRADLYAWGCLAYELLSGAPPFVRESPQRVLVAHLSEAPTPLGDRAVDCPSALARLVMRCLAKEPGERPAAADEVLRELEAISTPSASASPQPQARDGRTPGRQRAQLGIAVVVLALAGITVWRGLSEPAPATPTDRSIAVLPLANLSGDKADDYFGIGLAEEMTRALAKTGVRVIGRTSAGALLAKGMTEQAVAKELGVGSILTGTVQRADGQVRINVTLLSTNDGSIRWQEKYDRPLTNVFAVQDEIARSVAERLLGSLGGMSAGDLMKQETANPEAHALVLNGIVLWNRRNAPAIRQAIGLFQQALTLDPNYARAHAWLALANVTLTFYVDDATDPLLTRAITSAERAIAIDSTIGEAWTAAANVRAMRGQNREADALFRQAVMRDSTLAITWFWHGLLALRTGDLLAAHARVARAIELEPASLVVRAGATQVLAAERKFAAADSLANWIIALDSTFALAWLEHANALAGLGRAPDAIDVFERKILGLTGSRPSELAGQYAWTLAVAGRRADARKVLDGMRAANGGKMPPVASAAAALEQLGNREAGVSLLADAIARHDPWLGPRSRSVRFDALRANPRGAALLAAFEAR